MKKGSIVQVSGPVVDVTFPAGELPGIREALTVETDGGRRVMEVAQHVDSETVRCVMLSGSEGLARGSGREVLAVIQQDLRRDAEEAAEGQEAPQLRLGGAKLPAGDGLARDAQLFRQGLLGETAALAQGQELFRQFHGVPSFHRVASG